ncbi:MAG TPA: hypothetical protein VFW42_07430 [Fluviicoccus sp.]|nr:hypothetical protein [Fluviicoccus sp.]
MSQSNRIDYTDATLSALPFVYRPKRGSKELSSNWRVTPTTDYAHACNTGREYAAHFIQWLRQSDMAMGNALGLIVADMAATVAPARGSDDATHGYAVGFLSYLERLLAHAAESVDVWRDVEQLAERQARALEVKP